MHTEPNKCKLFTFIIFLSTTKSSKIYTAIQNVLQHCLNVIQTSINQSNKRALFILTFSIPEKFKYF